MAGGEGGVGGGGLGFGLRMPHEFRPAQPELPLQFITAPSLISIYQDGEAITPT